MPLVPDLVAQVYELADAHTRLRIRATAKALWPYLPPVVPGRGISIAAAALEGALVRAVQFSRKFGKLARQVWWRWRPEYTAGSWTVRWMPASYRQGLARVLVYTPQGAAWGGHTRIWVLTIVVRDGAYRVQGCEFNEMHRRPRDARQVYDDAVLVRAVNAYNRAPLLASTEWTAGQKARALAAIRSQCRSAWT